ncbi:MULTISPECIES: RNA polymerase sigma factor [unclassified Paenibacillus]|uniref:RNA polymerase sigma factor n=1 Tax=unclassified Paenibacillus TaxID=185978 RepID=UPI0009569C18|nr:MULTISPECIES: RNA polymerase sigma factor [unclassified Paenibacillus]ASS68025.2 RNA polymerase sigma factor [Paenibacillus sp. RUD330]SIR41221.1 RNA polymerase sigma-70 factor, ECF subfamily [Paenibacillus sp. RU4X]SIR51402.1 RNA polymerase sigma-70 factor, ECF subfamily [Paenibacillus sp. RU4T]
METETELELELEEERAALRRYCLALTRSAWEAEDLEQSAWCRALAAPIWREHANRQALLLRIARNLWTDHLRREALHRRTLPELQEAEAVQPAASWELEELLRPLELRLSPLQLSVWLLREVMNRSIRETAELLLTTEGAVKAAFHRARRALDGVRRDLQAGGLREPADEALMARLRGLAAAVRTDDAAAIAALAEQDVLEPAVAVGIIGASAHSAAAHRGPQAMLGGSGFYASAGGWTSYGMAG